MQTSNQKQSEPVARRDRTSAPDHLTRTFEEAERSHRDLMEPWSTRLAEAETADVRRGIMIDGLRETFKRRHPMPPGCRWPDGTILDGQAEEQQ